MEALDCVPLTGLLEIQNRFMWEHNGDCGCGRKTYLSGQCMKCLEDDLVEKEAVEKIVHNEIADEAKEVEPGSLQVSTTGEFLHPGATAGNTGALLPDLVLLQYAKEKSLQLLDLLTVLS